MPLKPCPQCGTPVEMGTEFCANCGYYMSWEDEPEAEAIESTMTRRPGFEQPLPLPPPPPPAAAPVRAATLRCPGCGEMNPETRTLCTRCGARLATAPPPAPSSRRRWWLWLLLGVVIAAIAAAVIIFLGGDDDAGAAPGTTSGAVTTTGSTGVTTVQETTSRAATTSAASTSPAVPVIIDPIFITATASSEATASGDLTYFASNTLDGSLLTAWNHNGTDTNRGVGETLTFAFNNPVYLASIEIVNGYAKSDEVFIGNGRIRDLTVITDSGSFGFALADHDSWQILEADYGETASVVLQVDSVYPGERWNDLAVTEIAFFKIPN